MEDNEEKLPINHIPCLMGDISVELADKGAVIPVVLRRRLAQFSPHVTGHFTAEIWKVELSEGGMVPWALKHPCVPVVQIALNKEFDRILYSHC